MTELKKGKLYKKAAGDKVKSIWCYTTDGAINGTVGESFNIMPEDILLCLGEQVVSVFLGDFKYTGGFMFFVFDKNEFVHLLAKDTERLERLTE